MICDSNSCHPAWPKGERAGSDDNESDVTLSTTAFHRGLGIKLITLVATVSLYAKSAMKWDIRTLRFRSLRYATEDLRRQRHGFS